MATLAEMLRQGADKLVNLPSEAQRFITNPQAFTQLITGKNPLPRETGFAAGATGLPAQEMSVLDPNQAPYMQGYSQGEPIGYAGMAAPFAAPAAVATAKALAPKAGMMAENYMVKQGMIQPLTAYHGTPHTIQGQFDINKVGTGEGAQAYGHGMYFAENPAVATQYKSSTIPENALTDPQKNVVEWAKYEAGDEGPLAHLLDMQQLYTKKYGKENVDKAVEFFKGGNLYKVDIPDADIPMMLDYDKPLSQQTPEVQKILKNMGMTVEMTGQDIYRFMPEQMQAQNLNFSKRPTDADVSKYLSEQGIKGIRYLDEGSRKEGKGTSNFVVFEPSQVKILEKNDKPVTRKELIQEQVNALSNDIYSGLQESNKSTFPKIPVGKVFKNPQGKLPENKTKSFDDIMEMELSLPTKEINIDAIVPTQRNLNFDNLKKVKNVKNAKDSILAVENDGKYYLIDGHHRVANEILKNKNTINVRVYEE